MTTFNDGDLRAWRARCRFSQQDVAIRFGVSQRSISMWEAGKLPHDFNERFAAVLRRWEEETRK